MPISTITPLSLTASVNLSILRYALNDLEHNHNFHISDGYWCCRACSISDAWECGIGKSYVFWHEQNEDEVHESSNFEMPLYFVKVLEINPPVHDSASEIVIFFLINLAITLSVIDI